MKDNISTSIEITQEFVKGKIYQVRGQKVMVDYDLAEIYGYETRYLNLQAKRNIDKFPGDFMFRLTKDELDKILMLQNVTSSWGGTRKTPYAFTEQGIYMLMTVLKGDLATKQSILIIRTFQAMKEAFVAFGSHSLITKGWEYAVERRLALECLGFTELSEPLIGHQNEAFTSYWAKEE